MKLLLYFSCLGGVAFHAYLSHHEENVGQHLTIIFDQVVTDVGGNYNHHTGVFTSPNQGVYAFSWTLFCVGEGFFDSQLVANSNVVGALFCSGEGAIGIRHTTGVVVININHGDVVFVKTHPTGGNKGKVYSTITSRSSFTGWKLF